MDNEARRAANRESQHRYRERLRQDADRLERVGQRARTTRRAHYWANRGRLIARQRAYVDKSRLEIYARNREYAATNRAKIRAQQHAAYMEDLEAHRARDRERGRARYAKDPQAHLDYMKRWRAAKP